MSIWKYVPSKHGFSSFVLSFWPTGQPLTKHLTVTKELTAQFTWWTNPPNLNVARPFQSRSGHHRCEPDWLGSSLRWCPDPWKMVLCRMTSPHQSSQASRHYQGLPHIWDHDSRLWRPGNNRQQHCSILYQQTGRNPFLVSPVPCSPTVGMVLHQTHLSSCDAHFHRGKSAGWPTEEASHSQPQVVPRPRLLPSIVSQVGHPRGGYFCHCCKHFCSRAGVGNRSLGVHSWLHC